MFDTLFGGGLGEAKVEPVDIKLKPGFEPYQHKGYYCVPKMFEQPAKNECNRLVRAGILKRLDPKTNSPWIAPSFFQPKKDMGLKFLTDFREINRWIERTPFDFGFTRPASSYLSKFHRCSSRKL